jgi:energy-coupling factor transporter ATP-binding protein EcfA2
MAVANWKGFIAARSAFDRIRTLFKAVGAKQEKMSLPAPIGQLAVQGLVTGAPSNPQKLILKGVSFESPAGQVIGVIGPSGAGKSSLARVLVGVWPVLQGTVRLDGSDLEHWNRHELGQYVGYLDEEGVAENSDTETFVAMKVFIDNWRWAGVPIYMRTGKKMPETVLEVLVEFKKPPRELFGRGNPNAVRFRLGAKDGVDISLLAKKPGTKLTTEEIDLTVEFVTEFGDRQGPYERLLRAAMLGDHFRFTRIDAVLHSWKILEDILKSPQRVHPYFEGTWGPDEAQDLIPGGWNAVGTQVED